MNLQEEIRKYTEKKFHELFSTGHGTEDSFDWEDIATVIEESARHFAALSFQDFLESEKQEEKNPLSKPMPVPTTIEEAIETLDRTLSTKDKKYLIDNGSISVHNSLGRWIRNEWGLWTDSKLKKTLEQAGYAHPDDMSNYIIVQYIKHLINQEWEKRDNWEYIEDFCNKFGRLPGDIDELDTLVSYVLERQKPNTEKYQYLFKILALGFIRYLDENRRMDKMCVSNAECEDIENALIKQDWGKLTRYLKKYTCPKEPKGKNITTRNERKD